MARTERQDSNAWINLVGDEKGFEGDTEKDKDLLVSLVGKSSFGWTEYDSLGREANHHDYGLSVIIFPHRLHQLRRKAA